MFGKGSHAFSSLFLFSAASEIIVHALSHYFNICTITYQALSSTQTAYVSSTLGPARNTRQLRSISSSSLYIPRVKTKDVIRAFFVAAPTLWNSLPASVKLVGNIVSFLLSLQSCCSLDSSPSPIRRRLAHCYTITRLLNRWVFADTGA